MDYVKPALERHLDGFWPRHAKESFAWTAGPAVLTLPELEIVRIRPVSTDEPWVYVTLGAWAARGECNHGFEFLLVAPREDPIHVETLAMVANFHRDPRFGVSLGDVVAIGRGWVDESPCDHLLVSLPYPFGPRLEHCVVGDFHIRFLWLTPVTRQEAAYCREHGHDALEARLEESGVSYLDPQRREVV